MAWLENAADHANQQEHCRLASFTLRQRQDARARLAEMAGAGELFGKERAREPGEPEEPVHFS